MYLPNDQTKIITYRDYENFDNKRFLEGFQLDLNKLRSPTKKITSFKMYVLEFLINMPLKT